MILSTLSTSSLEEVADAAPQGIRWFQLYVYKDRSITLNLVRRAEAAGYKALVLTVDTPVFGVRRLDKKNKFALPAHLTLVNYYSKLYQSLYYYCLFIIIYKSYLDWRTLLTVNQTKCMTRYRIPV